MKTLRFRNEKIKELREQMGMSQQELANAITARYSKEGVTISQGFISKMEVGDKGPGLETLAVLVDFFEVGYSYFLEGLEEDSDPHRVVIYAQTTTEAQTIRFLDRKMAEMDKEQREIVRSIAADCMAIPPAEYQTIHGLITNVMRLTAQERHMILMLAKRLSETQPLQARTVEADKAADLINQLPESLRVKALDAVRGVAVDLTQEIADLKASVSALLSVVDDVSDPDVRRRIRTQIAESLGVDVDTIK